VALWSRSRKKYFRLRNTASQLTQSPATVVQILEHVRRTPVSSQPSLKACITSKFSHRAHTHISARPTRREPRLTSHLTHGDHTHIAAYSWSWSPHSHLVILVELTSQPNHGADTHISAYSRNPHSHLILLMESTLTSHLAHGVDILSYSWNPYSHLTYLMESTLTSHHTHGAHTHILDYSWSRHSHLVTLPHSHLIILVEPRHISAYG
jgi:hypothetical protein